VGELGEVMRWDLTEIGEAGEWNVAELRDGGERDRLAEELTERSVGKAWNAVQELSTGAIEDVGVSIGFAGA
jgi:hypothetical protein